MKTLIHHATDKLPSNLATPHHKLTNVIKPWAEGLWVPLAEGKSRARSRGGELGRKNDKQRVFGFHSLKGRQGWRKRRRNNKDTRLKKVFLFFTYNFFVFIYLFLWLPHWEWTFFLGPLSVYPLLGWFSKEYAVGPNTKTVTHLTTNTYLCPPQTYQCYQTMSRGSLGPTGWREGWAGMRMVSIGAPPTPPGSCFLGIKKTF